jgi:hypothetical protein
MTRSTLQACRQLPLIAALLIGLALVGCGRSGEGSGGEGGGSNSANLSLIQHGVHNSASHRMLRMLVQAKDGSGNPLSGLSHPGGDFIMTDNGSGLPSEAFLDQVPPNRYPFRVKTVVMLDITTNNFLINHLSEVQSQLQSFFTADNLLAQQRIELWAFANGEARLVHEAVDPATLDQAVSTLNTAFDTNHGIEGTSTDLYGAALTGLNQWSDVTEAAGVSIGNLVLVTEGDDVADNHTLAKVLDTRGARRVYALGLGDGPNEGTLTDLGNGGYFQVAEAGDLAATLKKVQGRIRDRIGSFYHFYYGTTFTGDAEHTWQVALADDESASVSHTYNPGKNAWETTRDSIMLFDRPRELLDGEAFGPDGSWLNGGSNGAGYTLQDPRQFGMGPGTDKDLTLTTHWLATDSRFSKSGANQFSVAAEPDTGDPNSHTYTIAAPVSGAEEIWTFTNSGPDNAISDSVRLCASKIAVSDSGTTYADGGTAITLSGSISLSLANFACPNMAGNASGEIRWEVADTAIADVGGSATTNTEHDGSVTLNPNNTGTTILRVAFVDAGLEGVFQIDVP